MAHERLLRLWNQLLPSTTREISLSRRRKVIPIDHGWGFKQQDGSHSAKTFRPTATFPTNIHLDLLAHDLIPDPFMSTNENEVQWVGDETWVYRCSFTLPSNELARFQNASLIFEGLDTFAAARLDGKEILRSDNMFISHRVDVGELLRSKERHV